MSQKRLKNIKEDGKELYEYAWFLLIFIAVLPFLGGILVTFLGFDFGKLGPFGDFIAGTTLPLLTFISFMLIASTLKMQQEQLKMQQEELQLTREEYAKTNTELEIQNQTARIQRFENTFFNMLSLHNQIINSIEVTEIQSESDYMQMNATTQFIAVPYKGREVYKRICDGTICNTKLKWTREEFIERYEHLYKGNYSILSNYFTYLYNIIRYIDTSSELQSHEEKMKYIRILRAQMSAYELTLLFYNSLTSDGNNFKSYIVDFDLLDNMEKDFIPTIMHQDLDEMKPQNVNENLGA